MFEQVHIANGTFCSLAAAAHIVLRAHALEVHIPPAVFLLSHDDVGSDCSFRDSDFCWLDLNCLCGFLWNFLCHDFKVLMNYTLARCAVYFTCNQVDEKVKSSRKGEWRIFIGKRDELSGTRNENSYLLAPCSYLSKIGGTRSANLPLWPEHRPNFAQENEWCDNRGQPMSCIKTITAIWRKSAAKGKLHQR